MKKLVYFLIFALCVTLFSCTKDEVVTPNEPMPEIVAPDEPSPEIVTPNESDTETDENVIILPEPDEDTIEILLNIPRDFIDKPYNVCTVPQLTKPEDFKWGQYLPFVIATHYYSQAATTPYFSILSNECKNLEDGKILYEKVNEKYLIEYDGKKTAKKLDSSVTDEYLDYLYKSRVVYISQDASVIGRFRLIPSDNPWWTGDWDGIYDVIKDGEVAYSEFRDVYDSGGLIAGDTPLSDSSALAKYYGYKDGYVTYNGFGNGFVALENIALGFSHITTPTEPGEILRLENKFNLKNVLDISEKTLYYYSIDGSKLTHTINTVSNAVLAFENGHTEQYAMNCGHAYGNRLLVSIRKILYDSKQNPIEGIQSSYLYNLDSHEYEYVGDFLYGKAFSPDGKYLCFFSPEEPVLLDGMNDPCAVLPKGCYVKNIENNTVTFFETSTNDTRGAIGCINWIEKDKLYELINN